MPVPAPTLAAPGESTTPVLAAATDVTKSFGRAKALNGLSLSINAGEAVGLLGPNGAGKSTLISLLCGLRRPDAGSVEMFGRNPLDPKSRLQLGITPQATSVPQTLKLRETVDFVAAHYPEPTPTAELLVRFGLADMADKQCGALSGGQQRRLLVALALVGRPRLVVLDEPTTGLDVDARETLWQQLRDYRSQGGTLLITSHYLEEIQALASRVVVVDRGTVIADGSVDDIRSHVAISKVTLEARCRRRPSTLGRTRSARPLRAPERPPWSPRTPTRRCAGWSATASNSAASKSTPPPSRKPSWHSPAIRKPPRP
ncbi:ABC transporter ATP-binding protein [Arthrobacter mangrovi]|uniref:ABC transporter domain-containing protein n=1 Tax=Arthrobacter mangrovi TaxID=2966350 RepID=A0ABQ5MXU4_9MICC|nr:ABC transporter ATP-binding protein [Arthrobacter mangrovi]GLB68728.1 hypothetical protein AHIS1636_31700 [Arthrobacter mangrovi]